MAATKGYEYIIQTDAQVPPMNYAMKQFIVSIQRFTVKK